MEVYYLKILICVSNKILYKNEGDRGNAGYRIRYMKTIPRLLKIMYKDQSIHSSINLFVTKIACTPSMHGRLTYMNTKHDN